MGVGTLYLPPPASLPQDSSGAKTVLDPRVDRWGRGAGKIRASYPQPLPLARPEEIVPRVGGRGGVIIPNTKPALAPTHPYPGHPQRPIKSVVRMGVSSASP